jgi:uncharacterized protein YndB with AHSA1/START domain
MKLTELECTRQIDASPEEVYDVWIDPTCPGGPWFSPQEGGMKSKILFTAAVDGLFYHCVTNQGAAWAHYGRFTQLERGKLAEHTWVCEATKGRESMVTTTFEPRDGGTFVRLRHAGVPDDEEGRQQIMGWQWCLGMLAERMGKPAR